ncbi:MAG: CRTAC1 family protein [Gammaproteobacteria bacterium]|nr:CRTAC1 family protein [Gammaproteobacteria bacterium]
MSNTDSGEAIIRKAFYRSLLALLLALIAGYAIYHFIQQQSEQTPMTSETVKGPVITRSAPAIAPEVRFTDITGDAGIDFIHTNGAYGDRLLPETMGAGGGFIDYDNDGDQDIVLINSSLWPDRPTAGTPTSRLYNNDGNGNFTDVTTAAGLTITSYGMGLAVGDYDNDGWDDLYITTLHKNYLLHNEQGKFVDVSEASGTAGFDEDWSTAAVFFDFDKDSDLDLFVANYVEWTPQINREIDFRVTGIGKSYSTPTHYAGARSRLYRNDGDGRFTDISMDAGVHIPGKALSATAVDYDRDGLLDILVANDTVQNFLFHNRGDGRFEEIGALEGIAFNRNGKATGAMGIDTAWYRNDDELGIVIGNFANEMSSLFVTADGQTPFLDEALLEGLGADSRLALTFGVFFFDYDLDGRLDLLQANGHLENEINKVQPSQHYEQPVQLFWNCDYESTDIECSNRLILVRDTGDLATPVVGRGASYADIDSDGDLDVMITQPGREVKLYRNDQQTGHHWLRVRLEGTSDNRNAIGAVLELTIGGTTQRRLITSGRSFLSQIEFPVTFGLGANDRVDSLSITWPGGQKQTVTVDSVDKLITITQPSTQTNAT